MRGCELKGKKIVPGKCHHCNVLNYENKGKYKLPEGTEKENVSPQRSFKIQLRRLKECKNVSADVY